MTVLDAGAGANPAVPRATRPDGIRYVGLDISRAELNRWEPGLYDEYVVGDVTVHQPALRERFDLIVSLFLFEHVSPLAAAVDHLHDYLKPGGALVAQLAGGRSLHALLNRAIPHSVTVALLNRLTERPRVSVFPARYDGCTYSDLGRMFSSWSNAAILPQFTGAQYFAFSPLVLRPYLALEDWISRSGRAESATWYLVTAQR